MARFMGRRVSKFGASGYGANTPAKWVPHLLVTDVILTANKFHSAERRKALKTVIGRSFAELKLPEELKSPAELTAQEVARRFKTMDDMPIELRRKLAVRWRQPMTTPAFKIMVNTALENLRLQIEAEKAGPLTEVPEIIDHRKRLAE